MIFRVVFIAVLILAAPAFASEDGESYDDILDVAIENTASGETSSPNAMVETKVSENTDKKSDDTVQSNDNIQQEDDKKIFLPQRPVIETKEVDTSKTEPKKITEAKGTSLTEKLQKTPQEKDGSLIDIEGTWIEKIGEFSPSKLLGLGNDNDEDVDATDDNNTDGNDDIDKMMDAHRKEGKKERSNAAVFDIAGVMLRMNVNQAEDVLSNRGFKKINARYQIPNFIKWRNEELCRNSGVVGYERIQACVSQKAKKEGFEYIQYLKFAKFETKEEIEVYFTSNFTNNKVYRINYRSDIAAINGNSPKAVYLRNLKILDFWRKISRKYGYPDNETLVTWGLGGSKPYLKAKTGRLWLEDPTFIENDYKRMAEEDKRFINSDYYNF